MYIFVLCLTYDKNNSFNLLLTTLLTYLMIYYRNDIFSINNKNKQIFKDNIIKQRNRDNVIQPVNIERFNVGSQETQHKVEILQDKFSPNKVIINLGDTISWQNKDPINNHRIRIFDKDKNTKFLSTNDMFLNGPPQVHYFMAGTYKAGTYYFETVGSNKLTGTIIINGESQDTQQDEEYVEPEQQVVRTEQQIEEPEIVNPNDPIKIKDSDSIPLVKVKEGILNYNISSFDGICLNTGNEDYWRKSPDDLPLLEDSDLFVLQGHNNPLKPNIADYSSLYGPSIDGEEDSPNKLFMFSNNLSSPSCCPSTFTTSTGCICTTKKQRDFVISRGNNIPKNNSEDIS